MLIRRRADEEFAGQRRPGGHLAREKPQQNADIAQQAADIHRSPTPEASSAMAARAFSIPWNIPIVATGFPCR